MPSREDLDRAAAIVRHANDPATPLADIDVDAVQRANATLAVAFARELDPTPVDREWAFAVGEVCYVDPNSWRVEVTECFLLAEYGLDPIELLIGAKRGIPNPTRGRVRTEARLRGIVLKEPE